MISINVGEGEARAYLLYVAGLLLLLWRDFLLSSTAK
jgi:hypothetical protein